jgi:hypothetical protein
LGNYIPTKGQESQKSKPEKTTVDGWQEIEGGPFASFHPSGVGLLGSTGANGRIRLIVIVHQSNRMIARS